MLLLKIDVAKDVIDSLGNTFDFYEIIKTVASLYLFN